MSVVLGKNIPPASGPLRSRIDERLASGRSGSFFYVAPTRRRVRHLQREFLELCPRGSAGPMHLFTLETLAAALCGLLLPPRRLLSAQMQSALIQEAIRSRSQELRYFRLRGPARRLPRGTLQKITNVINRMKETGVYLSTLLEEIEGGEESDQLKLRDIHVIYEEYERRLGDRFIDSPGLLKEANHAWSVPGSQEAFRERYPDVDLLAVSGFDEFSDPELTLIHALSGVPGISTVVTFDYHPDNDDLFGHLAENYRKFLAMGFRKWEVPDPGTPDFPEHAARTLFRGDPPDGNRFDGRETISILSAPDRLREVELIGRIIKAGIAADPELEPGRICVCTPRPELYSGLFGEVFREAGIPANITDRFHLDRSPLVAGLLALLSVAQNNFRTGDILAALSCPFFDVRTPGGPVDAGNIRRVAADLKIGAGRNKWPEKISARIRFLRQAGGAGRAGVEEEIRRLERAERDIGEVAGLLSGFRSPMDPAGFSAAVTALLDRLRVVDMLLSPVPRAGLHRDDTERDVRAYTELTGFLSDFPEILSVEMSAGESRPLSWYLERFRPLLSQVRYNVRQRFGEGVLITSIDETRGLSFDIMIVAGLVEGELPSAHEPEIFLPQRRRERRERYHLHGERYLFYQALTNFSKRIWLTFPRKERGVDLGRSGFIESLEAIADVTGFGHDNPYAGVLISPGELIEFEGRRLSADGEVTPGAPNDPGGAIRDHLRHAISVEVNRRHDGGPGRFRGLLGEALPPRAAGVLRRYAEGTFSVTQLETYGDCPFRYFSERVLKLRAREEPEEGLTAMELGSLVHEVLFEFYVARRDAGLPPIAGLGDAGFNEAVEDLRNRTVAKFTEFGASDIFQEIVLENLIGHGETAGAMERMLRTERESGIEAVPSFFEVRFGRLGEGLLHSDPLLSGNEPVPAGRISLRGKIDRIDIAGSAFRIVDYKTGSVIPGKSEIEDGSSLQLPLYLHCAEALLAGAERGARGGAGIYYHMRPAFREVVAIGTAAERGTLMKPGERARLFGTAEEMRAVIDAAISRAGLYATMISEGRFPVEPRDRRKVCRTCDFVRICRIRTRYSADSEGSGTDAGDGEQAQDD